MSAVPRRPGAERWVPDAPTVDTLRDAVHACRGCELWAPATQAVSRFEERGARRIHKKPAVGHVRACHPWPAAELAVVRPAVVVCLGATAARAVLGREVRIADVRGELLDADGVRALVTTHPSAVLRMRGRAGWDEAFDALVADLRTAVAALG